MRYSATQVLESPDGGADVRIEVKVDGRDVCEWEDRFDTSAQKQGALSTRLLRDLGYFAAVRTGQFTDSLDVWRSRWIGQEDTGAASEAPQSTRPTRQGRGAKSRSG